jgi:hypothetical protein
MSGTGMISKQENRMTKSLKPDWQIHLRLTALVMVALLWVVPPQVAAQEESRFKVGQRIEADINMSSRPENARWRKATIVSIEMWQGRIAGIFVRTDDGGEYTLRTSHLRPLRETEKNAEEKNPAGRLPKDNHPPPEASAADNDDAGQRPSQFKVGDRVEVDSLMARDPKDSRWKKATVKAVDFANRRYVVVLDDSGLDMGILIRPDKIWIRHLNDGSRQPVAPDCPFNAPSGKVTKSAAPSAELFKRVIYEYRDSIKRGSKFGITFQVFEMGKAFRNVLTRKGRLEDFVPTNAVIYPVKTRQLVCEQFPTLISRVVMERQYSCYKDEFGDWVCRGGAPRELERRSIYTQ